MLVVSNYHYIRKDFTSRYKSIFGLTPFEFRNQLEILSQYASFISQSDLLKFLEKPFDKNYILITFDDGLKEQFDLAKPILEDMGIPYVFFINTENHSDKKVSLVHKIHMVRSEISSKDLLSFIHEKLEINLSQNEKELAQHHYNYDDVSTAELKYLLNFRMSTEEQIRVIDPFFQDLHDERKVVEKLYFSEKQIEELHNLGVLGSHGHRHLPFGLLDTKTKKKDFKKTQDYFLHKFDEKAKTISYPYGSYEACAHMKEIAAENDFILGFSMERAANYDLSNPLMLARFDCNDLPGGKNDLFKNGDVFSQVNNQSWYR